MMSDMQKKSDRILAEQFDSAGDAASGLVLDEIGLDGHDVANLLWKVAAYLKRRTYA